MAVHYRNLVLETSEDVYEPAEDSFLLADNIRVNGGNVLDIGTGTGIQALAAARFAEHVVGVDVNPAAVELAKRNAEANGIRNAEFRLSDLFSDVKGRFDLIISNPPYLPVDEDREPVTGDIVKSWAGGRQGTELINRLVDEAKDHLKKEGRLLLLVSSVNEPEEVMGRMRKRGYEPTVLAKRRIFFEELDVIEAAYKG